MIVSQIMPIIIIIINFMYTIKIYMKFFMVKVKQSRYRPGVAQRVPGS
jgi:hypothetical protein